MAWRWQRDTLGSAVFERLERMTFVAFGAFERHSAANPLLHFRLVARDATGRARLLVHRLAVFVEEVRATISGLAGFMADQAALRALAETFVFTVVVVSLVSLVVERRGKRGFLAWFLRLPCRVELGVDYLPREPDRGRFGTWAFLFLTQVMTADAVGRETLGLLRHLFFVEVTNEA